MIDYLQQLGLDIIAGLTLSADNAESIGAPLESGVAFGHSVRLVIEFFAPVLFS